MATLTGDIIPLNRLDPMFHAVGAMVVVKQGRKIVAKGEVTEDDSFSMELPEGLEGEIEIELVRVNAAPSIATANGNDLHVTLLYSNVNNSIA